MREWTFILLWIVLTVSAIADDKQEWLEVNIAQGPIRGRRDPDEDIYVFHNIPYATAPTGDSKFKAPLPPPSWIETYDAIDEGIICPQHVLLPFIPETLKKQENCLIANVYVPDTRKKNLSVLVYVHGGGFQVGYGDWLKAKNLMKPKDLIVVNFNYRLGIHGFLCLGTDDVPGNAGMKDQVALLRWVQLNIGAFGGNANDVTIVGSSAGSVSVDLLMISKSAQGLFHKVIPESGANIAPFATQVDPVQNAKIYAKTLNFTDNDDIYALEKFYKSLSYDTMTADALLHRTDSSLFLPCIERDTGDGVFLTEPPLRILQRGDYKKVPLLYGFAHMEGLFRIDLHEMWKDRMNIKFSDFLPIDLKFTTEQEREEVANQVKTFYFGNKPISNDNVLKYVDYFSDTFFVYSHLKAVKLHVEAGHKEVYLYEYSFADEETPLVPHTNVRGATHCAQTMAVLDGKNITYLFEDNMSEEYRIVKRNIRELWHNFVRTGKPVPDGSFLPAWPPVGRDGSPYMSIDQKLELRGKLSPEMFGFWDNIYSQYYREPVPPPEPTSGSRVEL